MIDTKGPLPPEIIDELTAIVSQAAKAVMVVRGSALAVQQKADSSPVTKADHASQEIILAGLFRLLPGLPVIAEEANAQPAITGDVFALVDPLDGTREFIEGREEFTINLALIRAGRPVFGIVAAPALDLVWRGLAGSFAERLHLAPGAAPQDAKARTRIAVAGKPHSPLRVMVSRSHLDPQTRNWLARHPSHEMISCGSAVKFCQLAEGKADIYPRLAPTMAWDVAAGDAVLTAAGGAVRRPEGGPLLYGPNAQEGTQDWRIPAFIATGPMHPL